MEMDRNTKMKQSTKEFIYGILWLIASFFMSMFGAWLAETDEPNSFTTVMVLWTVISSCFFFLFGGNSINKSIISREYGN